jgi:hypothetical protein
VSAEVSELAVDVEGHLRDLVLLHDLPVHIGAQSVLAHVDAPHQSRADPGVAVTALNPHRPGFGIAEVMQADAVGSGVLVLVARVGRVQISIAAVARPVSTSPQCPFSCIPIPAWGALASTLRFAGSFVETVSDLKRASSSIGMVGLVLFSPSLASVYVLLAMPRRRPTPTS